MTTGDTSSPGRVLVVDDDRDTLNIVALTLERAGYDVYRADSGAMALELVDSSDPDTVVLDLMMPRMSGLEVVSTLKMKYPWPPPVIILSAKGQITDRVEGMEAGAFRYLVKPARKEALLAAVQEAVAEKRSRPRLTGRM